MKKSLLETLVGFSVILIAIGFFVFARNQANVTSHIDSYQLTAKFSKIDGITVGSDVRVSGIKIGTVTDEDLDLNSYEAVISLNIDNEVKIPTDSIASIVSSGFFGKKYVAIDPGANDEFISDKGTIIYTQSSVNLETLIGKFMFKDNS